MSDGATSDPPAVGGAPSGPDAARRTARAVAGAHDENFPVVFALLPRERRDDMRAIYAFCRTVDDVGDAAAGDRLALLDDIEGAFRSGVATGAAEDPIVAAVADTVHRRRLDVEPFLRLIEANRMDQRTHRYATWAELLDYCRHSATPVGHMVLGVLGCDGPRTRELSDHTCIGLQLVNFWQDIRRDLADNDRVYVPAEDMARFGVTETDLRAPAASEAVRELIRFEVARARAELLAGAPLARMVPLRARLDLRMFTAGGLALCDAIARQDHDTLASRPAPGRLGRLRIGLAATGRMLRGAR